jgi:transcriptional regulator with XRE-family HTH domain
MTPAQSRAARGLLNWNQDQFASAAQVSSVTIRNFENEKATPQRATLAAMRRALESAGVIFVEENGEGPGVRLRKPAIRESDASLDRQIAKQETAISNMPEHAEPSPEAGMAAMDKAVAENDLTNLKNKRTRRRNASRK